MEILDKKLKQVSRVNVDMFERSELVEFTATIFYFLLECNSSFLISYFKFSFTIEINFAAVSSYFSNISAPFPLCPNLS